ncbi:MAG: hypothetical protein GY854_16035 [Deltaproteobacteria bacterium]|nr:hypothetical protein [Deltaproteobacteria bacterium]
MRSNLPSDADKQSKVGAGAAGVGGGTLVAVIANNLPETNALKPWLILIAPSLSIFLGAGWLWLQVKVANYLRDREVQTVIASAKKTLEAALANPLTSNKHRKKIQEELEKLELMAVRRHLERFRSLRIITSADISEGGTKA